MTISVHLRIISNHHEAKQLCIARARWWYLKDWKYRETARLLALLILTLNWKLYIATPLKLMHVTMNLTWCEMYKLWFLGVTCKTIFFSPQTTPKIYGVAPLPVVTMSTCDYYYYHYFFFPFCRCFKYGSPDQAKTLNYSESWIQFDCYKWLQ